jgi:hypothetical protein
MACVLGQVQETGCDYIVLAQRKNTDSSKKNAEIGYVDSFTAVTG